MPNHSDVADILYQILSNSKDADKLRRNAYSVIIDFFFKGKETGTGKSKHAVRRTTNLTKLSARQLAYVTLECDKVGITFLRNVFDALAAEE